MLSIYSFIMSSLLKLYKPIKQAILFACCLLGITACQEENDVLSPIADTIVPLSVEVDALLSSKAQLNEGVLPEGAEIGVFLKSGNGSNYDNRAVDNVKYTATQIETQLKWVTNEADKISLSATKGSAYAYYPRVEGATVTNVPIVNDGTDWMYSATPAANLTNKNNVATFHLVHAMSIIRCKVLKGDYQDTGNIESIGVKSPTLAKEATLNLITATLENFTVKNNAIAVTSPGQLTEQPLSVELWAIPTGEEGDLTFEVVVDGRNYTVNTATMRPIGGMVYNFTFTLSWNTLELSEITVKNWNEVPEDSALSEYDPTDQSIEWEEAKQTPGIYAITSDGKALPYEYANGETYAGVAFVVNGIAYQIAKVDALGDDGTKTIYWWQTGYENIEELLDYRGIDDVNNYGYFPKVDGTYQDKPHINLDYTHWINMGITNAALSDFKGKTNTDILIDKLGTVTNTIGKSTVDFRNNDEINEGYHDWFVPSVGQLGVMAIHAAQIEDILRKTEGAETFYRLSNTDYWTSTEWDANYAWYIGFWDGGCYRTYKYNNRPKRCRLIREL